MAFQFNLFVQQKLGIVPHFFIHAFLEWIMISWLFIDGFIAFLSTEFAKLFNLQIPCLFCTRIDHVLAHRNPDFYYNESICEDHKKNISSLAYCHVHRKLSDIKNMCEGCLLSFASEKDSDIDTYKSLVGIMHKNTDGFVEDDHKVFFCFNRCSCCGEPLDTKNSMKFVRNMSLNATIHSNAPAPTPRSPVVGRNLELPHIRYTELKFISDTKSELQGDEHQRKAREGISEDACKTPIYPRGNKFFGIPADFSEDASRTPTCKTPIYHRGNKFFEIPADISEDACKSPIYPRGNKFFGIPGDLSEDSCRTPNIPRGNKFFGIPLKDPASASASPRWANQLAKKMQFEKEFCFAESNDTNATNESEGNILHRLKRQIRLDRKNLVELYMELDEERSASAIAASNAMAMITRLQAEKAAVQMEALQYQRMMDEQAEYDQEALQVIKDMLAKREDEIKVLEADLEAYREKYGHLGKVGSGECKVDIDEDYQEIKSQSGSSIGEKFECRSPGAISSSHSPERLRGNEGRNVDEASLDFEGEKSYLLSMLNNLEKKGQLSSPSNLDMDKKEEKEDRGTDNKAVLKRELSLFRERLRTIEADSGFLKHAAMTLQRGSEGTKILTQIAQHLEKLRHPEKTEDIDA